MSGWGWGVEGSKGREGRELEDGQGSKGGEERVCIKERDGGDGFAGCIKAKGSVSYEDV